MRARFFVPAAVAVAIAAWPAAAGAARPPSPCASKADARRCSRARSRPTGRSTHRDREPGRPGTTGRARARHRRRAGDRGAGRLVTTIWFDSLGSPRSRPSRATASPSTRTDAFLVEYGDGSAQRPAPPARCSPATTSCSGTARAATPVLSPRRLARPHRVDRRPCTCTDRSPATPIAGASVGGGGSAARRRRGTMRPYAGARRRRSKATKPGGCARRRVPFCVTTGADGACGSAVASTGASGCVTDRRRWRLWHEGSARSAWQDRLDPRRPALRPGKGPRTLSGIVAPDRRGSPRCACVSRATTAGAARPSTGAASASRR